jgi:ABC-type multidrug transport system fused ATPase/permease subunit
MPPIQGTVRFEDVEFAYDADKPVLHGSQLCGRAGNGDRAGRFVGVGQVHHHQLVVRLSTRHPAGASWWTMLTCAHVDLNTFRSQLGVVLQESFLFDGTIRENILFSRPDATEEQFLFACRTARVDEFAERYPRATTPSWASAA